LGNLFQKLDLVVTLDYTFGTLVLQLILMSKTNSLKITFIAGSGSIFETFDFYIFAVFAVEISKSLFGNADTTSLILTFTIFASGYVARILGGLYFGYVGDRFSRQKAFLYTIIIIGVSSMVISIIPSYQTIGIFAPLILFVFRFLQGFAYGGELSGAIVMVSEHVKKHKGFFCGVVMLLATSGVLIADLLHGCLSQHLSESQMTLYGWRIAFFIGGAAIMHSYILRKSLFDSRSISKTTAPKISITEYLKFFINARYQFLLATLSITGINVFFSICLAYLPTYCYNYCDIDSITFSTLITIQVIAMMIGGPIGGWLSDIFSRRSVYLFSSILTIFITYFVINTLSPNTNSDTLYMAFGLFAFLKGAMNGFILCYICERFSSEIRYTGVAFSLNFGLAIFTGLPPILLTWLNSAVSSTLDSLIIFLILSYIVQIVSIILFERATKQHHTIGSALEKVD
jgi:MHS family proline/betaine transporter-like MFS transporter